MYNVREMSKTVQFNDYCVVGYHVNRFGSLTIPFDLSKMWVRHAQSILKDI